MTRPAATQTRTLDRLQAQIAACEACVSAPKGPPLPHAAHPVLRVSTTARLLIASQAPGNLVNQTGVPFNDPSGDRLRDWLGLDRESFYDVRRIAIVPMGFCFPGYDASGADLPPRRECRELWHDRLFDALPRIETVLAIGRYAQAYHFRRLGHVLPSKAGMTEVVSRWRDFDMSCPRIFPLPHPSWRNSGWLKRHPWFEKEMLPVLRAEVARLMKAQEISP